MKRRIRSFLDGAVNALGVRSWMEKRMQGKLTILMYHRVLPDAECAGLPLESLAMPLSAFACQVMDLRAHYNAGPLGPQWAALRNNEPSEKPRVAITFDDGYLDNIEHAAPLLEGAGLRATFFAATDFVGRKKTMWYDEVCLLLQLLGHDRATSCFGPGAPAQAAGIRGWMKAWKSLSPAARREALNRFRGAAVNETVDSSRFAPMTPADLSELRRRGHEIGSHTVSHNLLPQLDDANLQAELADSKSELEDWLEGSVGGFCYPNGDNDARVREAVREAGYEYACTTRGGTVSATDDGFGLHRVDVTPNRVQDGRGRYSSASFRAELCGFHRVLRRGK